MHVVVTGGSGYLGSHVVSALRANGHHVIAVSRREIPGFHRVAGYSHSPPANVVIHLAEEPDRAVVNSLGQRYAIDAAATVAALSDGRYDRVIYISSGAVYGDRSSTPFIEGSAIVVTDSYTQIKISNEATVINAGGIVARCTNLIGLDMARSTVIADVVRQLDRDGPLFVNDERTVRDFLSVTDAARAICAMVGQGESSVINVGSGIGTSVRQLALWLSEARGREREVISTRPAALPSYNVLDINRAKRVLGWWPMHNLRDEVFNLARQWSAA